ncbi:MAG: response regulator transcription factor [Sulfuricurvum sp.]|uniref:response regulator transcription factor n=1 Tax=Sulfuricurvum sp. TaxID=2025608 RepID=UPI00261AABCE|nr:response regulator transcription factor [Sulfuricurvum sp.]MDD2828791.1 response regulator transcription factor [Sulfuricurvum sp.]MDD4948750.1 response regulator transcription factor [Sulfuricurvum sp.]
MLQALMVEDDPDITTLLVNYLKNYGIALHGVSTPSEGLELLDNEHFNLIIVDLTLPQMDGLELCKEIRLKTDIPIIISSARSDTNDKVIGLKYGADDYLSKPYEPRELIARIKSVLRRYKPSVERQNLQFTLDKEKHNITFNGSSLSLTRAEYEILTLFILHNNQTLSRNFLASASDSISEESSERTIDVIIRRLRQKIEKDPKNPRFIHSIRGSGYRFSG